jgi:cobalt-zinc-cadmium resistance protein CzcA
LPPGIEPLRVKDLAEVGIGSNVRTGCAVENGEEAVLGTVMMLVGENSRIISKRVEENSASCKRSCPPAYEIRIQYARSEVVDRTIDTVKHNLFEGAILVVVVLLFLLGNWRAALIVALAIPLSFLVCAHRHDLSAACRET